MYIIYYLLYARFKVKYIIKIIYYISTILKYVIIKKNKTLFRVYFIYWVYKII